jgi:23S rRNA (guanosine2251-2'-O)-methyltransferase
VKTEDTFLYRLCSNGECRFRFPAAANSDQSMPCPQCGFVTLAARVVESGAPTRLPADTSGSPRIETFLDNIRSSYNVGSIFRTADGAGISHLYLCGITPTPEHSKVAKTALGADSTVAWSYHMNGLEVIMDLKDRGWRLWALESGPKAHPFFEAVLATPTQPILLIVGNERAGVDPEILNSCDNILSLPMSGHKQSLNVSVAFGVAAYWLRYGQLKANE